ncbi:MAG: hypothetical protein GY909_04620 [Oligoflexia bacterium]|nr:hypothetical protein [Oligoflexia bacterium]
MKKLLISFALCGSVIAGSPSLDNITSSDLDSISKEFSANFVHRPVSPASPLGDIIGVEVGLVAGQTDAPKIKEISQREDPTADNLDSLYHAGIHIAVSVPFGITGELIALPETELGDVSLKNTSFGLKYTFSELFDLPMVDLAIRGHYTSGDLNYSDRIDGVNTTISLDNSTSGFQLLASADLVIVEPFIGVGTVSRETTLKASGSARIFDTTFTTSQSSTVDGSSTQFLVGAQLNLLFLRVAAQYENVFDTSIVSGKLSFKF